MADETRQEELARVVALGVEMRAAQKVYFTQGRTRDQLDKSKKLERDFDKAAAQLAKPPGFI